MEKAPNICQKSQSQFKDEKTWTNNHKQASTVEFYDYRKFEINLIIHVFDDQQHRTVHVGQAPVQSLQAGPVFHSAVD